MVWDKRSDYTIVKDKNHYQVFNTNGKLLLYYNIRINDLLALTFIDSNIDFNNIADELVSYCVRKIQSEALNGVKIEFYLEKMTERILISEEGKNMLIDDYFLNWEGKFQLSLYNVYHKIKERIINNLDTYFQMEVPYTEQSDPFMMDILNTTGFHSLWLSNGLKINREIFESNIPNLKTGLAYVDVYHSNAKYFIIWDKEKPQDEEYGYVMMVENKIVLLYGIKC